MVSKARLFFVEITIIMTEPLGTLVTRDTLRQNPLQHDLAVQAWNAANYAACHRSDFPVGSSVHARGRYGVGAKTFTGCNVENRFFPATICAERNAMTNAIANGYSQLQHVAICCQKIPGGNSCGLCRQVLFEWGPEAVVLSIVDKDLNVRRFQVKDLLPAAAGPLEFYLNLEKAERKLVQRLLEKKKLVHAPYSGNFSTAVFTAENAQGRARNFYGVTEDNASYGGSTSAEVAAMTAARSNGYSHNVRLMVNIGGDDIKGANPIDGESLQKLREFGPQAPIILVNNNGDAVHTSLEELLPDSFGPDSL